jgi:hypothetical protein
MLFITANSSTSDVLVQEMLDSSVIERMAKSVPDLTPLDYG